MPVMTYTPVPAVAAPVLCLRGRDSVQWNRSETVLLGCDDAGVDTSGPIGPAGPSYAGHLVSRAEQSDEHVDLVPFVGERVDEFVDVVVAAGLKIQFDLGRTHRHVATGPVVLDAVDVDLLA